jgi:hypothetical protein
VAGIVYAFIHFSVEVACFYFIYSRLNNHPLWWSFALLFDALAFLPQNVIGLIADTFKKIPYGAFGCIMILLAFCVRVNVIGLIILCLGNCLVHIDGAQHTLNSNDGKITPNAVFVGGGSFGVICGQLLGVKNIGVLILVPLLVMTISLVLSYLFTKNHDLSPKPNEKSINIHNNKLPLGIFLVFVMFAVACRSYTSYAIPIAWKKTEFQAILLFSFMGIGKMMGGVFADNIGYRKTSILSLLVSLPFLAFGNSIMILSLLGVMLYSMTMPITVGLLVSKFKNAHCFAFGITTIALFLGIAPAFFVQPTTLISNLIVCICTCLTALLFLLITIRENKN